MNNALLKVWMILRQQREFRHHPARLVNDHPDKSGSNAESKQSHGNMIGTHTSKHHLIKIQPVAKQQSYRHKSYDSIIAFGRRTHINQYGRQEIDDQVQPEYSGIRSFGAGFEINGFFRNICVPDQHELREPEVGPEYGKGKLKLSEIMQMLLIRVFQITFVLHVHNKHADQCNARNKTACKNIPAE